MFSTSQHSTTWRSDHRAFHQSIYCHMAVRSSCIPPVTYYHMVVRSSCIPPVNILPHVGQIVVHATSQHTATCDQIIVHSTNYHSAPWWSDHCAFHQSTYCHMVIRSSCIPPVNILPHGDQTIVHSTSQHIATW